MKPSSSTAPMSPVTYHPSRNDLGGQRRVVQVSEHQVRALHEEQALLVHPTRCAGVRIHDAHDDAWQRMAHRAGLEPDLALGAVRVVRGHDRRHLGAAVAFDDVEAELLLERARDRLAQLLGAHDRVAQLLELPPACTCGCTPCRTSASRSSIVAAVLPRQLPTAFASIGFGTYSAPKPATIGNQSVPVKPNEWKNGSTPMMRSWLSTGNIWIMPSRFDSTLRCDSITPFGLPVLPLEKITVARSSEVAALARVEAVAAHPTGAGARRSASGPSAAVQNVAHHVLEIDHARQLRQVGLREEHGCTSGWC